MPLDVLPAFLLTALVIVAVPGPSMALVVAVAVRSGARATMPVIAGQALSHALFVAVTTLGLGALFLASAEILSVLKLVGSAYLIWLGVRQWRSAPVRVDEALDASAGRRFVEGFLVNLSNPKALVFYAAFFPPFVRPELPALPQLLLLGTLFLVVFVVVSSAYAVAAAGARRLVRGRASRLPNRIGGGALVGAGVALAATGDR